MVFAFSTTVLSAEQVGLATGSLSSSRAFQGVSSGFAIFCMVVHALIIVVVAILYLSLFILNFMQTLRDLAVRKQKRRIWAGQRGRDV